jgi:hypothetical protein
MQIPLRCTGKLYSRLVYVEGDQLSLQIQDTPGGIQVRTVRRVCGAGWGVWLQDLSEMSQHAQYVGVGTQGVLRVGMLDALLGGKKWLIRTSFLLNANYN